MSKWIDPDEALHLDRDWSERAEIREGDRLIRPAKGNRAAATARSEPCHLVITIEAYAVEYGGHQAPVVSLFAFPAISLPAYLAGKIFSLPAASGKS